MSLADRDKTAFVTHDRLFRFKVMSFGLVIVAATIERLIENLLAGLC